MSFFVAATLFPRSAWWGKLSEFSVITCCISEQGNGSSGPLSFPSAVQYLTCPPVFGGFIHTQQKLNIPDDLILPSRSQDTGNLTTNQTYLSQVLNQKLVMWRSQKHTESLLVRVEPLQRDPETARSDVENQVPLHR